MAKVRAKARLNFFFLSLSLSFTRPGKSGAGVIFSIIWKGLYWCVVSTV